MIRPRTLAWLLLAAMPWACRSAPATPVSGPHPASIARQLTFSPSDDFSPAWSPDGRVIVYMSNQAGTFNLWQVEAEGGTPRPLTFDRFQYSSPVFTPDGASIIVAADRETPDQSPPPRGWTDLWLLSREGTVERRLLSRTPTEKEFLPAVSRDGRLLAYLNLPMDVPPKFRLMVVELPGGIPRVVTDDHVLFSLSDDQTVPIRFSPDGRQILFTSDRLGTADVWVTAVDGSGARALTMSPAAETAGDWSPDGSTIVLTSDQTGFAELWLMDAQGQNRRQLTFDGAKASLPAFSPDGAWIVYTSTKSHNQDLWLIPSGLPPRP